MGFQNCDLFFDRVIIDDYEHTKKFKYFNEFKNVTELKDVPALSDAEKQGRIIAYNVGIALHDVYFAKKIYGLISANQ
jgi:ornithine cyclodeaminase/alanine dehydrogenase-like protein (mu-crystallin family)